MMHLRNLVVASALLALSLAPHSASEGHPDPPLNPAEERLQGRWDGFESDGKEPRWTLHFEGRSFRAVSSEQWYQGRIELRDGDPAELDLQIEDCECSFKGKTSKAIYRWHKDSIILDGPTPGDPRPVKFDTKQVQQLRLVRAKGK